MGSKKRKRKEKEAIDNHQEHHQAVHDYIVGQLPHDMHAIPRA